MAERLMMAPQLTVCTVTHDAPAAVALMRESLLKHHPDLPMAWFAWDHNSGPETADYLKAHWDYVHEGTPNEPQSGVGVGTDALTSKVQTKYTLVIDSDVEILAPCIIPLLQRLKAVDCITMAPDQPPGTITIYDYYGQPVECQGLERIDTAFALWRTDRLQSLLQHSSWGRFSSVGNRWFGDGGALLYRDALIRGLKVDRRDDLRGVAVRHYGQINMMYADPARPWAGNDPASLGPQIAAAHERYAQIQQRLAELRQL